MKTTPLLLAMLAFMGTTSARADPAMRLPDALTRVSPADFASRTMIDEDPLENRAVLSTQRSGKREGPARGAWITEAHARIVLDHASGLPAWQVSHDLAYVGPRKDITAVHYLVNGQWHRTEPRVVEHWLDHCPATDMPGQCNQVTRIVFDLPEEHALAVAAKHARDARQSWLIRFKDSNGESITVGFAPVELAGLEQAFADWRQKFR